MPYHPGDPAYYPVPPPPPDDEAPDTDRAPDIPPPSPRHQFSLPLPDCGDDGIHKLVPSCGDDGIHRLVPSCGDDEIGAPDIAPPSPRSQGGHVLAPTEPGR